MYSSSSQIVYGWDQFYKTIESDVNKKADVLIALFHFVTKHYNFSCVGAGADKTSSDGASGHLLPANWNAKATEYSLLYVRNNKHFQLLGNIGDGELQISIRISEENGLTLWVSPENLVATTTGSSINSLMPDALMIVDRYRQELLDPVFSENLRWLAMATPRPIPFPRRGGTIFDTSGRRPSALGTANWF